MSRVNRQWKLRRRPEGWPEPDCWELVESEVPSTPDNHVLLRSRYLSVDPYMRARIGTTKTYAPSVPIDGTMIGAGVAEVAESRHPEFEVGEIVETFHMGWQDYKLSNTTGLRKIDPNLAPISTALGVLGMNGLTAYWGVVDVMACVPGDTVVVSGAAGATGYVVGQIAKINGCRVVGTAGSDKKIAWLLDELGFDAAFNYKKTDNYGKALQEVCPEGIDCYFDNVGGDLTDAVFPLLNLRARVAICGQISSYNNPDFNELGPRLLRYLIAKRVRIQGFLIFDYFHRTDEALPRMARWLREGKLEHRETVYEGLERAPEAFIGMMQGDNIGKTIVKVT